MSEQPDPLPRGYQVMKDPHVDEWWVSRFGVMLYPFGQQPFMSDDDARKWIELHFKYIGDRGGKYRD